MDRDKYYAGRAIVGEMHTEGSLMVDYRRLLVKGAWKHRSSGDYKVFFYLLVPQHYYS
jgi:hypothetical protein